MQPPAWEIRLDSAGIQAADLLAWYRAFDPHVNTELWQSNTSPGGGAARWPLEIGECSFSSAGGKSRIPGLDAP